MAAPLLVMSTSSSTSQDMSRNPAPPGAEAQTRQDEAAPKPAGRGKRAAKPPAQKRPPQRGLGVAQLERLRQQEHWKKMTEMSQHQHLRGEFQFQAQSAHDPALVSGPLGGAPLHHCPADYCMGSPRPVACSGQMLGAGRGLGVQRGGSFPHVADRVVGSLYMAGVGGSTAALEPPRELSSMPNVRCFSDHCDICSRLKKKNNVNARKIVVLDQGAGDHTDNRERPVTNNRDFLALNLGNCFSCSGSFTSREEGYALHGNRPAVDQEVEVMDMGRKVKAVRGDSLLMEYEFFPGKSNSGRSIFPEKLCFPAEEDQEAAAAASASVSAVNRSGGGEASIKDPSSIDLSLRLSY